MSITFRKIALLALFGLVGAPSMASAADEVNVSTGATAAGPGLAVHGYDVVAYFSESAPRRGSAEFAALHEGATYQFAPAFGGFCAYGVSVGKKFDGDPTFWRIHAGRLYLNLNAEIQKAFNEDVAGAVAKAEQSWRKIANRSASSL